MKLESLVVVVVRIYALNFFFRGVLKISPILAYNRQSMRSSLFDQLVPWIFVLVFLALALFLWASAIHIAKRITRGVADDTLSVGNLQPVDWYTIAFVGVGLFYSVTYIGQSLVWIIPIFKTVVSTTGSSGKSKVEWGKAAYPIITFFAGIVLLFNARSFAEELDKHYSNENRGPGN